VLQRLSDNTLHSELRAHRGLNAGAVLADPPIPFEAWSENGEGRAPQAHYKCGPVAELFSLPVADIAAPDCWLFLWIPLRNVFLVEQLMDSWGWQFSGSAFGFAKTYKDTPRLRKLFEGKHVLDCIGDPRLWFMGNGYGTRHNLEVCWLGRRGKPKRLDLGVRELIVAPIREHSRKPDEAYARIEALCAGPYVEIYARQQCPNWIAFGDEIDRFQAAR
jgi:N6-adenosine-specific RNA methylase IME4